MGKGNSDIELLAGLQGGGSLSGASGRRIQHELENIINRINKNPAGVKLTLSKNAETLFRQDIAKAVSSVKIESFDTSAAIAKLKSDLRAALSGAAIPVGFVAGGAAAAGVTAATTQQTSASQGMPATEVSDADAAVKSLNTRLSTLNNRIKAVKRSAKESADAIRGVNDSTPKSGQQSPKMSDTTRQLNSHVSVLQQTATLTRRVESLLKNNTRIVSTGYGDALSRLLSQLNSGVDANGNALDATGLKKIKAEILDIEAGFKAAGLQGKTFWSVLKSGYEKFGGWALITKSMMAAANSVRQMIDNVTQLDAAMTELRKVTDESDATYEKFFADATVRARNLGATVTDTINASADFSRLGYSIEDAATLADTAIMYKNVGDGISDIGVASESIISTLKGFSLEAQDAMHVVDAFNEVGNNFAISSAGIGDALTRSAASLSAANNTMEESVALITAMNTTLQDPEKVGTTLKTITMYLRAAKADLEAAGESTDGMAISTSKLRKSILALTKDRVDVMLDESTFKSTYQIIKEISQVWSSMADVDQAALLELLGGKRNANATASLIQNFDIAEQALKSATDSAGSAASENEKYLDSILGKVAQFNAAFETLSATVIDADFSKGVVDAGTTMLDTINGLIDGLGTLNTLAMGVGAALSLGKVNSIFSPIQFSVEPNAKGGSFTGDFNIGFSSQFSRDKAGIEEYNKALNKYIKNCMDAKGSTEGYAAANDQLNEAVTKATTAVSASTRKVIEAHKETLDAGKVANKAAENKKNGKNENDGISLDGSTKSLLNFRLKTIAATVATTALNMAISVGLSLAIQGLITGIDYLIHRGERLTEAAEEAKSAVDSISGELDELKSSTDSAKTTLSAFGDQVKYVNGRLTSDTLSTEQIEQYSEAVKTLTDQYPELITGYDAEGNAIVDLSGGYETLTAKINEAYKAKLTLANAELDEKMPDIVKGISELRTERGQYSVTQSYYAESTDEYQDYQKKIEAVDAKIRTKWREINQSLLQYFNTDDSFTQVNEAFGGLLSNIVSGADWGKLIDADVSWDEIKSYVQSNIVDVFDNIDLSGEQANIKTLLSGGADLTVGTFNQVLNDVKATLMDATDNDKDLVKSIMSALEGAMAVTSNDVNSIVEQAYKGIDDGSSSLELLKSRAEQWIAAEKEFAEVSGESAESTIVETEAFNEFFNSIKLGNPTIAELQALIETTNDGSLEAAGSFAEWKQQYDECVKSFSNVKPYNDIVESFGVLKEVTDSAYESFVALNGSVTKEEYQSWEPDEYRNRSVETFNKLKALYDEGRVGTREFAQYKKYFELDDAEAVGRFIQEQADYYVEGKEGLENWLSRIYDMNRSGELAPDLASVDFLADGKASFDFDVKRINEIAEALHMTEEQVWNFIRATRAYSDSWESMSAEDLFEDFDAHGLFSETENGFSVLYEDIANYTGLSREEIDVLIDKLNELDQFGGKLRLDLGLAGELEAAGDQLEKIDQALRNYNISSYFDIDEGIFTVTQNMIDGMLKQLSPENVKQYIMQWSKISGVVIPAGLKIDTESVDALLDSVSSDGTVETHTVNHVESEVEGTEELKEFQTTLNQIQRIPNIHKRVTLSVSQPSNSTLSKITSSGGSNAIDIINQGYGPRAFAEGTQGASPGLSLLGDEASPTGAPRPELVVSDGEAYLAGVDGPTIGYLKRGDQVYTYSQTKKILGNNKNLKRIPAFSTGIGNFGYRGSVGAGSLWSSVASSSSSSAGGSDFESLYKYHQHLLKMEQESQRDYLNWLNKAYKDAYARGEIELDDYYKYQEEIFDLIRELVQDNLDDAEHYIDMLGHYDGNEKQIIAIYKDLMSAIEKEIASARAAGLTDNDEYIQNLQKQWKQPHHLYSQRVQQTH